MERRCGTDVAFRYLCANHAPDYRSIARFRRRHLGALKDLFVQVLACCAEAGLVKLGRVALDGTKHRASASRHKAMSYDCLSPRIEDLEAEVKDLLAKDARSDDEVQEAAAVATEKATPDKAAQRNFTDPESRMMKTNGGFHYAYNAQAVVDEEAQVILAVSLTQAAGDVGQLFSMADRMADNLASAGIEGGPDVMLAERRLLLGRQPGEGPRLRPRLAHRHGTPEAPRARAWRSARGDPQGRHPP